MQKNTCTLLIINERYKTFTTNLIRSILRYRDKIGTKKKIII